MQGLVLAGGGARGAYEAGVLRYVFRDLPKETGVRFDPRVVCGTSIGALNGAWVAAYGGDDPLGLSDLWTQIAPEQVYRLEASDLVTLASKFLPRVGSAENVALFDASPLWGFLDRAMDWRQIHSRVDRGDLLAFVVAATDISSGGTVLFTDGSRAPRDRAGTRVVRTRIDRRHCLASGAIPFIFPAVDVDGRWYADGGLRQNTPLAPAVHLGVDRVLIVSVKQDRGLEHRLAPSTVPTPVFLAGKALNAMLLDPIEDDLRQLESVNRLLAFGRANWPDFEERARRANQGWRIVESVYVRPTVDLGQIALEVFKKHQGELPWATRMLLSWVASGEAKDEADMLSFLFFHHRFTAAIEQIGWEDGRAARDRLAAVFAPQTG